jgi:hypothetical protein
LTLPASLLMLALPTIVFEIKPLEINVLLFFENNKQLIISGTP